MADHISVGQDVLLRGALQQQTTRRLRGLLYEGPPLRQYPQSANQLQHGGTSSLYPQVGGPPTDWSQHGLRIQAFTIHSREEQNTITVGIGFRYRNGIYTIGDWDDSEAAASVINNRNYQSRTAVTFWSGIATPADQDAIIIQCTKPFGWISLNVTTASINTNDSDADIDYSDAAGTAWVTMTAGQTIFDQLTLSAGELGTTERLLVFNPPHDWGTVAAGGTLHTAGATPGMYALLYRWSDIPDTDPIVTGIEIGSMKTSGEALATLGTFSNEKLSWTEWDADGIVAFFDETDPGHLVEFECAPAG